MGNYNKVLLMGNITRDPELKYLPSQMAIVEFGLAVRINRVLRVLFVQWKILGFAKRCAGGTKDQLERRTGDRCVVQAVVQSGAKILSLKKVEPTLEDVFVQLVGRRLNA